MMRNNTLPDGSPALGYETPEISDFGTLCELTLLNPGGNIKLNGTNFDAHVELAGDNASLPIGP